MLNTILEAGNTVDDDRTVDSIYTHLLGEVVELDTEIDPEQPTGVDGIVGEAIDVAICAIDIAIVELRSQGLTDNAIKQRIKEVTKSKCEKWVKVYG